MAGFRSRFHAWLAIIAMLIGALAPSVSRALSPGDRTLVLDICSSSGVHQIVLSGPEAERYAGLHLPATDDSDDDQGDLSLSSCLYCFNHAGSVGLPGLEAPPFVSPAAYAEWRLPYVPLAPRNLVTWSPSHPRAPPLVL